MPPCQDPMWCEEDEDFVAYFYYHMFIYTHLCCLVPASYFKAAPWRARGSHREKSTDKERNGDCY